MATVGFDIGNKSAVVAVAQRGGIDVLMNEVSSRLTPYVQFRDNLDSREKTLILPNWRHHFTYYPIFLCRVVVGFGEKQRFVGDAAVAQVRQKVGVS